MNTPKARWWHRLLLAVLGLLALPVIALSLWLAFESSRVQEYRYSWQGDELGAIALECSVSIYDAIGEASVYCGDFNSPRDVLNDMAIHGAINADSIPKPRGDVSDAYTLQSLAKSMDLKYSSERIFQWGHALKPFGIAAAVIFGYFVLANLFFMLVLWIAHGTTRLSP